ncbi:DUF3131 domain-containing protein [Maridesulfovibrio ferrireducens]|uniref:DUF3131 domain-containing protein n=1 Tax=Maridesulfovibrio ferrireducens TaxID=246191 RepID=UPI001A283445|nr:DUF3131 domain-containing protein [Maridesulfovibrio ferrireducens]MBI9113075.1 DUF3131 domain-containing protein [Maridesulfovibrio ferrireducens]
MKKKRNLVRLLQVTALVTVLFSVCGCKLHSRSASDDIFAFKRVSTKPSPRHAVATGHFWEQKSPAVLSEKDTNNAKQAWAYFERTIFPETGLPQGAVGSDTLTMYNIAGYLAALTCAKRLEIIDNISFHTHMTKLVTWLNSMQLNSIGTPNTFYNARTGQMIQNNGQQGEDGHSAIDIGRMLIWLRIVRNEYPTHAAAIDRAVLRWNFRKMLDAEGLLYGAYKDNSGQLKSYRQGRLGPLQYAAKGFALWGFNVKASMLTDHYSMVTINEILLPFDNRPIKEAGLPRSQGEPFQIGAVVTGSSLLGGIEMGWLTPVYGMENTLWPEDETSRQLASASYEVQQSRYEVEGLLTARTDHNLDHPPYFVIDSVLALGEPFATIDKSGKSHPEQACVSTGATFLLWAMFDTPYTDLLMNAVPDMFDSYGGWYAGYYEDSGIPNKSISLNDNAAILEALTFVHSGILYRDSTIPGYWELTLKSESFESLGLPPSKFQTEFQPLLPLAKAEPMP